MKRCWTTPAFVVLVVAALSGCYGGGRDCPDPRELVIESGSYTVAEASTAPVDFMPGEQPGVVIDAERNELVYTFEVDGERYEARYAIEDRQPFATSLTIGGGDLNKWGAECVGGMSDPGPTIDAVLLKRGGEVIATATGAVLDGRTTCDWLQEPSHLEGPADGVGVPLGNNTITFYFERFVGMEPGDQVEVVVVGESSVGYHLRTDLAVLAKGVSGTRRFTIPEPKPTPQ